MQADASRRSRQKSDSSSSSETSNHEISHAGSSPEHKSRSRSSHKSQTRARRHSDSSTKSVDKSKDNNKSRHRKKKKRRRNSRSTVIEIGKLTQAVTKEHVLEIFSQYGRIRSLEIASDRSATHSSILPMARAVGPFQRASVEYESRSDAARARKYGNGGMIDRQEITVELVSNRPSRKH